MDGEFYPESDSTLIQELRRGFENLGRDIRGALSVTNAGVERLSGDIRYGAGLVQGAGRTFAGGAGGRAFNFMSETFSKEFNRPALWSRDIMYMLGKDPRDMSKGQAQYYAREHWNQRFRQFGSFAAKDVAPIAMLAGGWTGAAASLGYEAFVSPHIVDQKALYKWKNYLDRSSQSYILAGASENRITGRGWGEQQLESIGRFHLQYEKENRYFKKDEQFAIEQLATSQGYYQKTTSMAQYKRKYKELIEGTREVMKTLHISMEEAVGVMSEISRLKVTDQKGFIKGVGMAAAYSGLSSQQVMRYAGAFGGGMDRRGFTPGYGAEVGIELLKQPARNFMAYTVDKYTKDPMIMAAFYTPEGKFDTAAYNEFKMGRMGFQEVLGRGAQNVATYQATGKWGSYLVNREKLMSQNITPAEMANLGPIMEYQSFLFRTQGTPYQTFDYFMAELKERGTSAEDLKKIRTLLTEPFKGKRWAEYAQDIQPLQGGGNIFQQIGRYGKAGWAGTFGKVSGVFGDYFNKYGMGIFSQGYKEIEDRGRLDEQYLIARRIKEDFRTTAGVGYKEVGKWLGTDLSGMAWVRFKQDEEARGSDVDWDLGTWKAEAVRQEMEKYNRLIGYVKGDQIMEYDKGKAGEIRGKIAGALGDYKFKAGGTAWYSMLKPVFAEYGETPEVQAALQTEIRTRMRGQHQNLMTFTYPLTGLTKTQRIWAAGKEKDIWGFVTSAFKEGGFQSADIDRLAGEIKALPEWGKYREEGFEGTREKWVEQATSKLIRTTEVGKRLAPDMIKTFINTLLAAYEGGEEPVIGEIRKKHGEIQPGDMASIEDIMAGIGGAAGGAIIAETLRHTAEGMWTLKESIEAMHKDIIKERENK